MTQQPSPADRIREGIEAARAGERERARGLFESALEDDPRSEKGWFWMASVVDSDEERRTCLQNVLTINPGNDRAKAALDKIDARQSINALPTNEVAAGVTQRSARLALIIGALVLLAVVVLAGVLLTTSSQRAAQEAAETAAAIANNTQVAQAAIDNLASQTAAFAAFTQTAAAIASPTPTATQTPARATLPPEFTPTFTPAPATARPALAAPPADVLGRIAVWGGNNPLSNEYLPIGFYDLDTLEYTRVGNEFGVDTRFFGDPNRLLYRRYNNNMSAATFDIIAAGDLSMVSLPEQWVDYNFVFDLRSATVSRDTRRVGFAGFTLQGSQQGAEQQLFVFDAAAAAAITPTAPGGSTSAAPLDAPTIDPLFATPDMSLFATPDGSLFGTPADASVPTLVPIATVAGGVLPTSAAPAALTGPLITLTNDDRARFSEPAISPDGLRVAAVREDLTSGQFDLVVINVTDGVLTPLTTTAAVEKQPRWSADSAFVAFVVAPDDAPDAGDIFIVDAAGGEPIPLVTGEGDDLYPVFSPEGRFVAFSSNRAGVYNVYVQSLESGDLYQVSNSETATFPGDWWQ